MKKLCSFLLLFFSAFPASGADSLEFQAGPGRNTLVQLFTSDGSQHCNPALEWMTAQVPRDALWKEYVPVALHVNLWDGEGFKDSAAKLEFNRMLADYRGLWKVTNVYPPTVAANGIEWSGWSRGQDPPSVRGELTGVLSVRVLEEKGMFSVSFKPAGNSGNGPFTLHSCLLGFEQYSKPADGKNRGKNLRHDFIARQYQAQEFRTVSSSLAALVELPTPRNPYGREKYGVAFWVTKKGESVPIQTTGGFLTHER